jgi:hypothetical protein
VIRPVETLQAAIDIRNVFDERHINRQTDGALEMLEISKASSEIDSHAVSKPRNNRRASGFARVTPYICTSFERYMLPGTHPRKQASEEQEQSTRDETSDAV